MMSAPRSSHFLALQIPLRIRFPDRSVVDLGPEPDVTLTIHDPSLSDWLQSPRLDVLAAAYVESRIDLDGPIMRVVELADRLSEMLARGVADALPANRDPHAREEDVGAISYHYDISNDFYRLWLDPEMTYSCAYFETGSEDLATAQTAKLRHLCRKLRLRPGHHLLDVGCGWGALSRLAAREFGVEVSGITLSRQQLDAARQRVCEEGLQDRVRLALQDYRDLPNDGRFDAIVSVGMLEHVGHANLPLYMQRLHDAVRPGGLVMNHGITAKYTDDRQQRLGHGGGDFIDRYVFPHGEIPSLALLVGCAGDAGLEVVDVEGLRPHYARTLSLWSGSLEARLAAARTLVDEKTLRIWRLYLAGCAYAFQRGWVGLHQVLAVRPRDDGGHDLPWSRRDIYT